MSQTHAHPNHDTAAKAARQRKEEPRVEGATSEEPAVEGHTKSHAAHLSVGEADHTNAANHLRHGAAPVPIRQPPSMVTRVGKTHKGE